MVVARYHEANPFPKVSEREGTAHDFVPGIHGLPMLLGSLSSLAHLRLELPGEWAEPPYFYKYHQVFPRGTQWDKLESITLQYLAITANQFMDLVTKRMPNLRRLTIAALYLLEGRYECVFQAFSEIKPPLILNFVNEKDNNMLMGDIDTSWEHGYPPSLFQDLGRYVTSGVGRHPCLPNGLPDSAAAQLFHLETA